MNYIFSQHGLEQMKARSIPVEIVQHTLHHPQQVVKKTEQAIYQPIINFEEGAYLVRVFINTTVEPNKIITVYRTSKIKKYYEG